MSRAVPATASEQQICQMSHDNVCVEDFSISVDPINDEVRLTEQHWGEMPNQEITLPRNVFSKLIHWYSTGEVPKEDARSRTPPKERKEPTR